LGSGSRGARLRGSWARLGGRRGRRLSGPRLRCRETRLRDLGARLRGRAWLGGRRRLDGRARFGGWDRLGGWLLETGSVALPRPGAAGRGRGRGGSRWPSAGARAPSRPASPAGPPAGRRSGRVPRGPGGGRRGHGGRVASALGRWVVLRHLGRRCRERPEGGGRGGLLLGTSRRLRRFRPVGDSDVVLAHRVLRWGRLAAGGGGRVDGLWLGARPGGRVRRRAGLARRFGGGPVGPGRPRGSGRAVRSGCPAGSGLPGRRRRRPGIAVRPARGRRRRPGGGGGRGWWRGRPRRGGLRRWRGCGWPGCWGVGRGRCCRGPSRHH
jgi:hypothetical protein